MISNYLTNYTALLIVNGLSLTVAIALLAVSQETIIPAIMVALCPTLLNTVLLIFGTPFVYLISSFNSFFFALVQLVCLILKVSSVHGFKNWFDGIVDASRMDSNAAMKHQAALGLYAVNIFVICGYGVLAILYRCALENTRLEHARMQAKMRFRSALAPGIEHDLETQLENHSKIDGKVYTTNERGDVDEEESEIGAVMVYVSYVSMFFLGILSYMYPSSTLSGHHSTLTRRPSHAITAAPETSRA